MKKLNLMLHCGAEVVERGALSAVLTPEATKTWQPIAHDRFVDEISDRVRSHGMNIVHESHGLSHSGKRYFGMLQVSNGTNHPDYATIIGLRNSNDKSFPAGCAMGSGVFVCDNLAFSGEVTLARKHTSKILEDLPNLVDRTMGELVNMRHHQDTRIEAYKDCDISDVELHDLLVRSIDNKVLAPSKLPKVLHEYRDPGHEEFADRKNLWRLFNAYTEVLKGTNVFNLPRTTTALHGMMDSQCGLVMANAG